MEYKALAIALLLATGIYFAKSKEPAVTAIGCALIGAATFIYLAG